MSKPLTLGELKYLFLGASVEKQQKAAPLFRAFYRRDHTRTMIYAIQAGLTGPVKIGQTTGPVWRRLKTLQTANAEKLHGLAAWRALPGEEAFLHLAFDRYRLHGEWFRPEPDLLSLVTWEGGEFCDWEKLPADWEPEDDEL